MNITQGKQRAVILGLMETYGVSTILQNILPYTSDPDLSLSIALSALDLDRELWIRSQPILVPDPETDINQMAFEITGGLNVIINRARMEGDSIVPRFGIPLSQIISQTRDILNSLPETFD